MLDNTTIFDLRSSIFHLPFLPITLCGRSLQPHGLFISRAAMWIGAGSCRACCSRWA